VLFSRVRFFLAERVVRECILLFLVAFFFYNVNLRPIAAGDSVPASLIPVTLLTEGTLRMDKYNDYYTDYYRKILHSEKKIPNVYFFHKTEAGFFSTYPIATGLLVTPLYAVPVGLYSLFHPTTAEWVFFAQVAEKIAAATVASGAAVLFYLICLRLSLRRWRAWVLTFAYAFASEAWTISSQALWQHGPGVFFILAACLAALAHLGNPSARKALLIGFCCGFAIAIRPTNVLFAAALGGWVLIRRPSFWFYYLFPVTVFCVALASYNAAIFGNVRGGYTAPFQGNFLEGFSGILFSPGRGFFLYFPLAFFGLAGYYRAVRRRDSDIGFYSVLIFSFAAQILLLSKWPTWWGGHCFGPRYLTEVQPMILLASIPWFREARIGSLPGIAFAIFFVWSLFIQGVGAFVYPSGGWDMTPVNIDDRPSRAWDWIDNPVSRDVGAFLNKH
jgi:hypothetical protein